MEPHEAADSPAARARATLIWLTLLGMALPLGLFFWLSRPAAVDPTQVCKMVWIPGGEFRMGTGNVDDKHKEEGPAHTVQVKGFWMDETEVTNAQFEKFVAATGYVTVAEQKPGLRPPERLAISLIPPAPALFVFHDRTVTTALPNWYTHLSWRWWRPSQ